MHKQHFQGRHFFLKSLYQGFQIERISKPIHGEIAWQKWTFLASTSTGYFKKFPEEKLVLGSSGGREGKSQRGFTNACFNKEIGSIGWAERVGQRKWHGMFTMRLPSGYKRRLSSKRKNESWQPRGTPREMYLHADLSSELRTHSVPVFKIWHRIWHAVTLCSMWSFSHLLIGRVVTSRWMVAWWHTQIPCWEKEGTCRICPSLLWDSHHVTASSFLLPFIY